jgi:chlorite dismutase
MTTETKTALDIRERGRTAEGEPLFLDRRLFMQFFAFGKADSGPLIEALKDAKLPGVLYEDLNDPSGVGLLTFHEEPDFFIGDLRTFLHQGPFSGLTPKPEYTLFGRTYALGHEPDLEHALLRQPRKKVCDPAMPWAIWYPLRRRGTFETLSAQDQRTILMEHGGIGHAYGRAGYGTDIRLACHGLDKNDNDFVIGLIGPQLFPLSSIVERMRQTKQTSMHIEHMGPFFTGRAVWQNKGDGA